MAIHHTPGKSQVGVETSPAATESLSARESHEQRPGGKAGAETTPQAATDAHSGPREATETPANPATRPWTPDTSTTIKMKRACNGCGTRLGDVTDAEMARAINGLPLPDVRRECPPWDRATERDHAYWERQAAAVRRAVARGGFKTTEAAAVPAAGVTGEGTA